MANTQTRYKWAGIDRSGKRTTGVIAAVDTNNAQLELKKSGIEVTSINETHQFSFGGQKKHKITNHDILLFTRFLATMMTAGLPILQAIEVIAKDQDNLSMRTLLTQIRNNLSGGKTLTESFRKHPKYFSPLYCSLISTGEKSGSLDKILLRLSIYMEKTETLRRKVKKALIYPIAVISISLLVSGILLIYVVPQFQTIYSSFGAQLPYFTRIVVHISDVMRAYWWIVLSIIGALVFAIRRGIQTNEAFAEKVDGLRLRITIVGPLMKKSIIARFTRTLAIALDSGMPIVDAMKSMADIVDNKVYRKAILQICNDVVNGHQLNVAMQSTKLFPSMAIQMIAIGETSGALADMLNKTADYYEEDVGHMVDNLSNLLEPIIMVVLGLIIGSFVVAMYLPIFKLGSIVK